MSKSGKPFAFLKLTDTSSSYEGTLWSEDMKKYGPAIESGLPLFAQAVIEKQADDLPPRLRFNVIKTLDEAITENSKGLEISIKDVAAVKPLYKILMQEHYGAHKIYLKPEIADWDVRIELKNGYALDNGNLLSKIRAIAGISMVKEV
jgi:DNA polymerase III alpha subunit